MRLAHNGVITLLGVAMLSFLAGYRLRQPASTTRGSVRNPLYYRDPMHPAYRSDKPGIAPDCGMQLEPVYADSLDVPSPSDRTTPGAVSISVDKQQLMGLRTAEIVRGSGSYVIRALGRVTPDESRIHRVTALADGVIRQVSPYTVGNLVRNDDLLATYFVSMWATGTGADVMRRIAAPMVGGIVTSFLLELLVYLAIYEVWRHGQISRITEPERAQHILIEE